MIGTVVAVVLVILFLFIIAMVVLFIYMIIKLGNDPYGLCIGYMKDDGLCCDTSFSSSDYSAITNIVTTDNIPQNMDDKNAIMKFMLGMLQLNIENKNIGIFENQYNYSNLFITYARMYTITRSDNPQLKDVFIVFNNVHDYNKIRSDTLNGATLPTTHFPAGTISYQYLSDIYQTIKTTFSTNYPDMVNNLYVVTKEDSATLGYQFRLDFHAINNIQFNFGEVNTFVDEPPFDPNMYKIVSSQDKYSTLYGPNIHTSSNGPSEPDDPNYLCIMDYHRAPYWNLFSITP